MNVFTFQLHDLLTRLFMAKHTILLVTVLSGLLAGLRGLMGTFPLVRLGDKLKPVKASKPYFCIYLQHLRFNVAVLQCFFFIYNQFHLAKHIQGEKKNN